MSYTVHRLILSYGFFIVPGCDLVCGVLCTWCELCQVIWSDRTNCYIRLSGTHWENPSEWKRGCGAIWWFDVWYSAKSGILFDCRAYYWAVQNVIPNWRRFPKWERGLYLLCGCVGLWDVWLSGLGDLGWYCTVCYIWVGCGNVFFCDCQSGSYARTLFSDICCWSCMVLWLYGLLGLCALLPIYHSILVWYRWGYF